jgi:hypothetical protein
MKEYVCGKSADGKDRICTEEEVELVQKLRGGQLKAVDPSTDLTGKLQAIADSLDPEKIAAKVGEVVNTQNTGAGFLSYLKHEEDCPNCRELHRKHVAEHITEYAAPAGPVAAAAKAEEPAVAEKTDVPAAKPAAEDNNSLSSVLDRAVPIGK